MEFISELKNDKKYVLESVEKKGSSLQHASDELKNDKEVVLEAVKQQGYSLQYASFELRNDKEIVLEAIKQNGFSLIFASEELRNDKEFVLEVVKQRGFSLQFASEELRNDKEFVLEAVKQNVYFDHVSEGLRNDKEVVLEAVKKKGSSLQHASDELKNDKEVVLEAVKQNGWSLRYASSELRSDKVFFLEAVKQYGSSLEGASSELQNDKEFVLEAVKRSGSDLEHTSEELKNDKRVVLEAVKQLGLSLEYASSELRNNKEIVLEAVKGSWFSLRYASSDLQSDVEEVVVEAMKQSSFSLMFASSKFQNDEGILKSRRIGKLKVFTRKFKDLRGNLEYTSFKGSFNDVVFHAHLGRGAYGGTYLCSKRIRFFVVKVYNNLKASDEKKEEVLSRDRLYIPPQINVVSILKHWENETLDLYKFPDYEEYWKDRMKQKERFIPNCGVILMNYYETTLYKYLDARMEKNERFESTEIRRMFWGLLCGVCHLHENMIVHRDLHRKNIFVVPSRGRILIGDFGCCLDLRENKTGFKVHKDHELMFSFTSDSYFKKKHKSECGFRKGGISKMIPPEIQNFDPLIDEFLDYSKSDIYSLGKIGFILLDHLKFGEDDFGLSEFMKKLVIEDQEKRLGCFEAMEIGKFIKVKPKKPHLTPNPLFHLSDSDEED